MNQDKLFVITDGDLGWDCIYNWWTSVWAPSKEYALAYALLNYGGECRVEERPSALQVISVHDQTEILQPVEDTIHEERRVKILRLIGWHEEGEIACDACGLYALGMDEYYVCPECYVCYECGCECKET